MFKFVVLVVLTFLAFSVSAHPERTASDGCHYCRTNCDKWKVPWNKRHCHNGAQDKTNFHMIMGLASDPSDSKKEEGDLEKIEI